MKTEVTVVLSSHLFIRNYVSTKVFDELDGFKFSYILESKLSGLEDTRHLNIVGLYDTDSRYIKSHVSFFNVVTWRFRHLSKSFLFRIKRVFFYDTGKSGLRSFLKRFFLFFSYIKARIFGSDILFELYKKYKYKTMARATGLDEAIQKTTAKIILFPSSSYDPVAREIIEACAKYKKKCVFLIDNWDNLSSKSILLEHPDLMGVWGEQSKEHAIEIQGMAKEKIHVIGTPRFEIYKKAQSEKIYNFPYMTYCGCAIPFDETSSLAILDEEITNHPEVYGNLKIVYRPHPWRQARKKEKNFRDCNFKNVILDKQMQYRVETQDININVQPDLNYYPNLIKHSLGSICPLSTMIIENLICGRPVLVLAYDDGTHKTSPSFSLANYKHFEGLEKIDGISFSPEINNLGQDFRSYFIKAQSAHIGDVGYILKFGEEPYSARLQKLLKEAERV